MSAVVPPEQPSGRALWLALGGLRGLLESVLPELAFLVIYAVTKSTWASVGVPLALGVAFLVVRIVQRQTVVPAVGGVLILAVSAVTALLTGNAVDNFVPGFFINGAFFVLLLISLGLRRPLVGFVIAALSGHAADWRSDERFRRGATAASWVWVGLFGVRLLIELPLYFAGATEALALARLLTGVPLYAVAVWFTWLLLRSPKRPAEVAPDGAAEPRTK